MAEEIGLALKEDQSFLAFDAIEGSDMEPLSLLDYLDNPSTDEIRFRAKLEGVGEVPAGVVLDEDGWLSGRPEAGTAQDAPYRIVVTAETGSLRPFDFYVLLHIWTEKKYRNYTADKIEELEKLVAPDLGELKSFWEKFSDELALPPLQDILSCNVTPAELEHLFERFATLTVWNADTAAPATTGERVQVEGVNERYHVYDFGVALVATPAKLFDGERTWYDSLQAARALMREAARRGWNVILEGFEKMAGAAWVEVQQLNRQRAEAEPKMQVSYEPTYEDHAALSLIGPGGG